jgi:hypothetical protein
VGFLQAFAAAVAVLTAPTVHAGFQVAQRDGLVVFSRRVGDRFWLVERRARGPVRLLPVRPAAAPFDVEVAVEPRGGLVVAFARCDLDGPREYGIERRACRLGVVRADGRGRERPLGPSPSPGVSHRFPALQGGRLAYVRVPDRGGSAEVVVDGRVALARDDVGGPDDVFGLDLSRYGVAVALVQVDDVLGFPSVVLKRPGRREQVVAATASGEENRPYVISPAFAGPYLYWGFANHGWTVNTKRSYVFRRDLASGARTGAVLSPYVTSVAVDAGHPDRPVVVTTDDALDSPGVVRGRQRVRRLRAPRYAVVPHDDLVYP